MGNEFLRFSQPEIAKRLGGNPNIPYERKIIDVAWVSPNRLPVVFHTSNTDGINTVSPAFCQSFDYSFMGGIVPVTYVLPLPHVNRVKGASEIWGTEKKEAFEQTGLPYTYLMVKNKGLDYAQIRMGSTMLDKYLLAVANSGFVFRVKVAEMKNGKARKVLKEYISLMDLPVIDAYKFTSHSPTGLGMGGLETHLPFDISSPNFVGYQKLDDYLTSLRNSSQKSQIIDVANALITQRPENAIHGIFEQLVEMNRQAIKNATINNKRLLVAIEPTE